VNTENAPPLFDSNGSNGTSVNPNDDIPGFALNYRVAESFASWLLPRKLLSDILPPWMEGRKDALR
jgi:hypothetical protein